MSVIVRFRAILPDRRDRRGTVEIARQFAARWGAQDCRMAGPEGDWVHAVAAHVEVHGIGVEIDAAGSPSDYQFRIHVDDDHVFDLFCSASPEEGVGLYWDSGPQEWIPGTWPNGLRGDDGMLYALELTEQVDGLELVAWVAFDHISHADIIAWLEARCDVSMEYLGNS
ncbi:hypothetical protein [Streptomyces bobili]|uniref:hypothetical protein n=1 Tax=Streptomyces bobili TaxID=67280 RepID=UPI00382F871B